MIKFYLIFQQCKANYLISILPDDERLVEVPEVVESDSPAQPVRSHELPQLLHNVLQQLGVLLPRPLVEPNGEPGERRIRQL